MPNFISKGGKWEPVSTETKVVKEEVESVAKKAKPKLTKNAFFKKGK